MADTKKVDDPKKRRNPKPTIPVPPGDVVEAKPVEVLPTVEIKGRRVSVKKPSDEQIVAWWELIDQMQDHVAEVDSFEKTMDLIKGMSVVVDSVMPEKADRDWLQRGRLSGELGIQDTINIVVGALGVDPREEPKDPDAPVEELPGL